ncbi:N-(5'-phosphoribosyl)anthranilate isomerase [Planktotalea sp.]|uniref:N-(5'-phosphoribosyl)anthranilate isomerase n=1 Tax=Planktotalea sp. TaxID=2029877 RepID=UPI0025E2FF95|nr:N-(5'-phosphoribosyl)anthranilate isomerase [Planktotalea sp.]
MDGSTLSYVRKDWLESVFSAKAARNGGVIRRKISWVEQEIGRDLFELEVHRRGFRLLETRTQLIVICNSQPIRIVI